MKAGYIKLLSAVVLLFCMAACSKMDDTYKGFIKEGELIYPSPPDSLKVRPGKNRIQFQWLLGDPTVSNVKIFWNNSKDSFELPVKTSGALDTITATLNNMKEGTYTFHLYSYDAHGNRSIEVTTVGDVYGSQYEQSLLTRLPRSAIFGYDTLKVSWASPVNETSVGTKIYYRDTNGVKQQAVISPDKSVLTVGDYDFDSSKASFTYQTMYLPDPLAIDTFYTAIDSMSVTKMQVVADGHNYAGVFADDGQDPHYVFFVGYPRGRNDELVWKYDLKGDSLLAGFPKKVTKLFSIPYPQTIKDIRSVAWLSLGACFFGNGHYYVYDFNTNKAGPLQDITDLCKDPWHKNFPKRVECGFYMPDRNANYLFAGDMFDKMGSGRHWFKGYPHKDWGGGLPAEFTTRGLTGAYFNEKANTVTFFSGDEFIVWSFNTKGYLGGPKKISAFYKGL